MKYDRLYKYLDVNGALAMITNKNLQFTNPYYLNDPYDCNPGLFDYEVPDGYTMGWADKDFIQKKAKIDSFNVRRETWVCSLSRRNDNMLMWSYYTGHKGVCVGLKNELAVSTMTRRSLGQQFLSNCDVKYKEIREKPNTFKRSFDLIDYQYCVKSLEWQHEEEVRHIIYRPHPWIKWGMTRSTSKREIIPWGEVRFYPQLTADCFDAIYLGLNISESDKLKVLKAVKTSIPRVPVYQMFSDDELFGFTEELVDVDKYLEEHKEPRLKELWLKIVAKIPFRIKISFVRTRPRKVRRRFRY